MLIRKLLLITPPLHGIGGSESGSQPSQVTSSLFTISNAYSPARPTSTQCCWDTLRHAQLYPLSHIRATGKTIPDALQPNSPDERMHRDPATLQDATPCPARHNAQQTEPATTQCQKYKPGTLTIPPLAQIIICHGRKGKHSKLPPPTQNHVQPPHPTPPPTKHAIPANNITKSQHTHPQKPSNHSTPKTSPVIPLHVTPFSVPMQKGKKTLTFMSAVVLRLTFSPVSTWSYWNDTLTMQSPQWSTSHLYIFLHSSGSLSHYSLSRIQVPQLRSHINQPSET